MALGKSRTGEMGWGRLRKGHGPPMNGLPMRRVPAGGSVGGRWGKKQGKTLGGEASGAWRQGVSVAWPAGSSQGAPGLRAAACRTVVSRTP